MKINIAGDLYDSLANGPGMRYVLFTQGCSLGCPGCQNTHTWNPKNGVMIEIDKVIESIKRSPFIDGVTLSGGDPMEQPEEIAELCKRIKNELPELNIMIYTGRTIETLKASKDKNVMDILSLADYLVDGRYIETQKMGAGLYTGSNNQRIIDLKRNKEITF